MPNQPMHQPGAFVLREALICAVPGTKMRLTCEALHEESPAGDGQGVSQTPSPTGRGCTLSKTAISAAIVFGAITQLPWVVTLRSYGPIEFGMPTDSAQERLGRRFTGLQYAGDSTCDYGAFEGQSDGPGFMIFDRKVVRVDVWQPGIATASGVQVGDSEDRVRAIYGDRITVRPHKYTAGHYLIYKPSDSAAARFGMVFETDGSVVTTYRAGLLPQVEWVEGCA